MPEEVTSLNSPADRFNEERLIQRIREGEHELFYELIRPYERRVYSAALAILRNEADAEDAAQEAVLKAFKNIRQFRGEARFSTWLIQITVNEARMWRRKEHAHLVEPIVDREDAEGDYIPREFADRLRASRRARRKASSPTGGRFLPRLWSGKKSARNWRRHWRHWDTSTARCSCCVTCST